MDTIWDGKSFEVGGHWTLWRGNKKNEWPRGTDKSRTLKKQEQKTNLIQYLVLSHSYMALLSI